MKKFISLVLSLSFFLALSTTTMAKDCGREEYGALQDYNSLYACLCGSHWDDYDSLQKCFDDLAKNSLQTERLVMEKVCEDDIPGLAECLMHPDMVKYLNATEMEPFKTKEDAVTYVRSSLKHNTIKFAIKLKDTKKIIGSVGYTVVPGSKQILLGYYLGKPYQGNGYAFEAVTALTLEVFGSVKSGILNIYYKTQNSSSEKLAKRVITALSGSNHATKTFTTKNETVQKDICEYVNNISKSVIGFSVETTYLNQDIKSLSFIKYSKEGVI